MNAPNIALFSPAPRRTPHRRAPLRALWLCLGLAALFCLVNYCYTDLQLIARHSLNFWDVLFSGRLLEFYRTGTALAIGQLNPQTGEVPYDIWVYLPYAVWNLPVYWFELLTGHSFETSFWALLWIRLGTMLPLAGSVWALRGIGRAQKAPANRILWACYLFLSSLFLFNGLFCLGQVDVLNLFYMLMGLWAYQRRDGAKFLLWFALAISCKMFALFCFVPLLLLREKRVLRLAGYGLAGCSLTLLSKLVFLADKAATPTQFDERRFLRFLMARTVELGGVQISLCLAVFAALAVWCWLRADDGDFPTALFAAFAGYLCFFLGATTFPYWAVVLAPYPALLLLQRPRRAQAIFWLDTAAAAAYFAYGLCDYGGAYAAQPNLRWMLAGRLCGMRVQGVNFYEWFRTLSAGAQANAQALLLAVEFVCLLALLALARPASAEPDGPLLLDRGTPWLRLAVTAGCAALPLVLYLL